MLFFFPTQVTDIYLHRFLLTEMRALIAMSGGVDSSVAAKIMTEKGFECVGCTMKLYDNEDAGIPKGHTCCSLDDIQDARSVAYELGMNHYVFNFKDSFREKIIDNFAKAYLEGKTPNPCIDCNRYMKFDKLFERAEILNCDYVVTGHYARIEEENGKFVLKKALDDTKDQSYVLYDLTQEKLSHLMLPLGGMRKTEIRQKAEECGFVNANKPDSQDICFVPDGDYASVIEKFCSVKSKEGDFVDTRGNVLGRHKGIIHYTIGQRKGLGISGGKKLYVCKIDPESNTVVLGDNGDLFSDTLTASDFHFISGEELTNAFRCKAKIRYRQNEQWATVYPISEDRIRVVFDEKQRAITSGQAVVLYDGDVVLGGGKID